MAKKTAALQPIEDTELEESIIHRMQSFEAMESKLHHHRHEQSLRLKYLAVIKKLAKLKLEKAWEIGAFTKPESELAALAKTELTSLSEFLGDTITNAIDIAVSATPKPKPSTEADPDNVDPAERSDFAAQITGTQAESDAESQADTQGETTTVEYWVGNDPKQFDLSKLVDIDLGEGAIGVEVLKPSPRQMLTMLDSDKILVDKLYAILSEHVEECFAQVSFNPEALLQGLASVEFWENQTKNPPFLFGRTDEKAMNSLRELLIIRKFYEERKQGNEPDVEAYKSLVSIENRELLTLISQKSPKELNGFHGRFDRLLLLTPIDPLSPIFNLLMQEEAGTSIALEGQSVLVLEDGSPSPSDPVKMLNRGDNRLAEYRRHLLEKNPQLATQAQFTSLSRHLSQVNPKSARKISDIVNVTIECLKHLVVKSAESDSLRLAIEEQAKQLTGDESTLVQKLLTSMREIALTGDMSDVTVKLAESMVGLVVSSEANLEYAALVLHDFNETVFRAVQKRSGKTLEDTDFLPSVAGAQTVDVKLIIPVGKQGDSEALSRTEMFHIQMSGVKRVIAAVKSVIAAADDPIRSGLHQAVLPHINQLVKFQATYEAYDSTTSTEDEREALLARFKSLRPSLNFLGNYVLGFQNSADIEPTALSKDVKGCAFMHFLGFKGLSSTVGVVKRVQEEADSFLKALQVEHSYFYAEGQVSAKYSDVLECQNLTGLVKHTSQLQTAVSNALDIRNSFGSVLFVHEGLFAVNGNVPTKTKNHHKLAKRGKVGVRYLRKNVTEILSALSDDPDSRDTDMLAESFEIPVTMDSADALTSHKVLQTTRTGLFVLRDILSKSPFAEDGFHSMAPAQPLLVDGVTALRETKEVFSIDGFSQCATVAILLMDNFGRDSCPFRAQNMRRSARLEKNFYNSDYFNWVCDHILPPGTQDNEAQVEARRKTIADGFKTLTLFDSDEADKEQARLNLQYQMYRFDVSIWQGFEAFHVPNTKAPSPYQQQLSRIKGLADNIGSAMKIFEDKKAVGGEGTLRKFLFQEKAYYSREFSQACGLPIDGVAKELSYGLVPRLNQLLAAYQHFQDSALEERRQLSVLESNFNEIKEMFHNEEGRIPWETISKIYPDKCGRCESYQEFFTNQLDAMTKKQQALAKQYLYMKEISAQLVYVEDTLSKVCQMANQAYASVSSDVQENIDTSVKQFEIRNTRYEASQIEKTMPMKRARRGLSASGSLHLLATSRASLSNANQGSEVATQGSDSTVSADLSGLDFMGADGFSDLASDSTFDEEEGQALGSEKSLTEPSAASTSRNFLESVLPSSLEGARHFSCEVDSRSDLQGASVSFKDTKSRSTVMNGFLGIPESAKWGDEDEAKLSLQLMSLPGQKALASEQATISHQLTNQFVLLCDEKFEDVTYEVDIVAKNVEIAKTLLEGLPESVRQSVSINLTVETRPQLSNKDLSFDSCQNILDSRMTAMTMLQSAAGVFIGKPADTGPSKRKVRRVSPDKAQSDAKPEQADGPVGRRRPAPGTGS